MIEYDDCVHSSVDDATIKTRDAKARNKELLKIDRESLKKYPPFRKSFGSIVFEKRISHRTPARFSR